MRKNKKDYLIVDGYNIINAWDELKNIAITDLEHAREKLIDAITEYAEFTGRLGIIVFDAYNLDRLKETSIEKYGMKIVFTKRFQTADTYIEAELARIARRHNVKVVTDDGQVQNMALVKGASRMTALELKTDLDILRSKIKKSKKVSFNENYDAYPISKALKAKLDELKIDLDD